MRPILRKTGTGVSAITQWVRNWKRIRPYGTACYSGTEGYGSFAKLTPVNLSEIPYYAFTTGEFAGQKDVIISNTGYTGAGGFELYFIPKPVRLSGKQF